MATPKKQTTRTRTASQPPRVPADAAAGPTNDEIAERAYQIFVARGGEPGHDLDDWLEAESELLRERAVRRPSSN
jgi:hypothetical protein